MNLIKVVFHLWNPFFCVLITSVNVKANKCLFILIFHTNLYQVNPAAATGETCSSNKTSGAAVASPAQGRFIRIISLMGSRSLNRCLSSLCVLQFSSLADCKGSHHSRQWQTTRRLWSRRKKGRNIFKIRVNSRFFRTDWKDERDRASYNITDNLDNRPLPLRLVFHPGRMTTVIPRETRRKSIS